MIYHLDQFDGSEVIPDDEGQDFENLTALRKEALLAVRELVAIVVGRGELVDHRELRIRDCTGLVMMVLPFRDSLGID